MQRSWNAGRLLLKIAELHGIVIFVLDLIVLLEVPGQIAQEYWKLLFGKLEARHVNMMLPLVWTRVMLFHPLPNDLAASTLMASGELKQADDNSRYVAM